MWNEKVLTLILASGTQCGLWLLVDISPGEFIWNLINNNPFIENNRFIFECKDYHLWSESVSSATVPYSFHNETSKRVSK